MTEGVLHGVRVLELTQVIAGPYAAMLLADMGAEVVKVEPLGGVRDRSLGSVFPGTARQFQAVHRGKKSLALDVATHDGIQTLYRILPTFDVLITNFRDEFARRCGFDYEALSEIHPGLIYARISSFGMDGPLADAAGVSLTMQAYSGDMAEEARIDTDGNPRGTGSTYFVDITTGTNTALGVVGALLHRNRTGEGQLVDAILLRTAMAMINSLVMQEPVSDSVLIGTAVDDARQRFREGECYENVVRQYAETTHNRINIPRPYFSGYTVKDGAIFLGCTTRNHRARAREIIGVEGIVENDDEYDPDNPADVARAIEVKAAVNAVMPSRTMEEWISDFRSAGLAVAPVLFPPELVSDPHAAQFFIELDDPLTGPQKQLRSLFEMSKTPVCAGGPSPVLGSHTDELLARAGLSAEEIRDLKDKGIAH